MLEFYVDSLITIHFFNYHGGVIISDLMINGQIRDKEVRLIANDGEQLGVMSAREAQKLADEAGLDLVKISPKAKPPVCKIIDYGKYKYEQTRKENLQYKDKNIQELKEKLAKKKQKVIDVKEVRMSPNIDTNDLNTKINHAKKFLAKGARVKVTLRFRGRELAHVNASKYILDDFAKALEDVATIDKKPKFEGRSMTMFLAPKNN